MSESDFANAMLMIALMGYVGIAFIIYDVFVRDRSLMAPPKEEVEETISKMKFPPGTVLHWDGSMGEKWDMITDRESTVNGPKRYRLRRWENGEYRQGMTHPPDSVENAAENKNRINLYDADEELPEEAPRSLVEERDDLRD